MSITVKNTSKKKDYGEEKQTKKLEGMNSKLYASSLQICVRWS